MQERDTYPPGVPCWVDTGQPDPKAALEFYGGLFGWEFEDALPPEAGANYFVARMRGKEVAAIGSQPPGMPSPAWNTYVCVEDADSTAAKATEAGGQVLSEPFDVMEAGRMAVLADPEGAMVSIWQPGETKGAVLVNEPGTWNFSELNTRDPEGAGAFYTAVFGWEVKRMEADGAAFTMFCMPGYGDFLAERDPGLRERMETDGAPEGFADAVAWMIPIADEADERPAHWSITFATDDADAAATRAAELGGEVVVPPFDAPYVRMTILRDPQGAMLTASKYVPPE